MRMFCCNFNNSILIPWGCFDNGSFTLFYFIWPINRLRDGNRMEMFRERWSEKILIFWSVQREDGRAGWYLNVVLVLAKSEQTEHVLWAAVAANRTCPCPPLSPLPRVHHLLQHRRQRRDPRLGDRARGGEQAHTPDPGAHPGHSLLLQDPGPQLQGHGAHVWGRAVPHPQRYLALQPLGSHLFHGLGMACSGSLGLQLSSCVVPQGLGDLYFCCYRPRGAAVKVQLLWVTPALGMGWCTGSSWDATDPSVRNWWWWWASKSKMW